MLATASGFGEAVLRDGGRSLNSTPWLGSTLRPTTCSTSTPPFPGLSEQDPRAASLVKLRIFAGLTQDEAATALGVVRRTADRDWAFARAWLFRQLSENSCRTAEPDGA